MQPILIRNFPGVAHVEFLLLPYAPDDGLPLEVDLAVDDLSRQLFGIRLEDTKFPIPEITEPMEARMAWRDAYHNHEDNYDTPDWDDATVVDLLLELGLDFRNEGGHPLRCVMWLRRQAEAAGKGLMGSMPDPATLAADKLTADREAFLARKKARPAA